MIGGMWAGRKGYMSEAVASQDRVIAALKMQVDLCREDSASLKERVKILEQERTATRYVLKREGFVLTLENGYITVYNANKQKTSTIEIAQIKTSDEKEEFRCKHLFVVVIYGMRKITRRHKWRLD